MGCDVRNLHGEPSKSRAIFGCYGLWDLVSWRLVEENIYRKQDVFGLLKPRLHHPCLENVANVISNMRLVSRLAPECSRHPIPISQWIRLKSISSARTRQFRSAHILCHAVAVDDGFALDESTPGFLFIRGGAPWFYHFGFMVRMSHLLYHVSMPNCLTNKHNSGVPFRSDIEIDEYPWYSMMVSCFLGINWPCDRYHVLPRVVTSA